MKSVREAMYKAIDEYGLSSDEALKASQEMDKHIVVAQKMTKSEFAKRFINDKYDKKYASKNQADLYIWEKKRACGRKDAEHKKRQPHYRSK